MSNRRRHENSHNGCAQCKRRRVRCDEGRPTCKRCLKYGGLCEYPGAALPHSRPSHGTILPNSLLDAPVATPNHTSLSGLSSSASVQSSVLAGMRDMTLGKETIDHLELLHYYTSSTYLTISDSIEFQHIWQDVVPKEALSHTFLMHGILALAAVHIAYDRPAEEDRYVLGALKHYDVSIGLFRTVLQQVTADNCSALFAFSTILLVITLAFAQIQSRADHGNPVGDLIQVFTLLQGTQAVLRSAWQWIALGPLGPLVRRGLSGSKQVAPPKSDDTLTFERTLDQLKAHNERIAENVESRELYNRAIQRLRGCVERIATYPGDRAAVMGWLVFLESSYVSSLESGEPMALVVFAHYGVILHTLRQDWFVRDLGAQVVEMVHSQVDDVWMPLLYWPMQQVGLRAEGSDADQGASSN